MRTSTEIRTGSYFRMTGKAVAQSIRKNYYKSVELWERGEEKYFIFCCSDGDEIVKEASPEDVVYFDTVSEMIFDL